MSCQNCNEGNRCGNPCGVSEQNSAACESLPSQIQNFTDQFFGTVVKTEVDGVVSWSLPCNLDVGLPANPRGVSEGLACYFLRLFLNGIVGLKGDTGATGADGTNGKNAYTVTLLSFTQPSMGSPLVQVTTQFNPAVVDGSYIFIATSGWYVVNGTDGNGVLFLQLVSPLSGAPATIAAGKLVVPAGIPGNSIMGPQGPVGPQGATGPAGSSFTTVHGTFKDSGSGQDFSVPATYTLVAFPLGDTAEFLLPDTGTYLVNAMIPYTGIGAVSASGANTVLFKLKNVSTTADVPASEFIVNFIHLDETRWAHITTLVTTSAANQTVGLYASAYSAGVVKIESGHTFMNYVRVS